VFWRAAVHNWKTPDGEVEISLGPYEEPIRRFLLDEAPFPDNAVITSRVSNIGNVLWMPVQKNRGGFHVSSFGMLGLVFDLSVGSLLPPVFYDIATAPNPRKPIWIVKSQDDFVFSEIAKIYKKVSA